MRVVSDKPNLQVYSQSAVAAHYAALDYLTACERHLFERYIPKGTEILDVGVGGGRTTPYLSKVASRYLGVDYSEEMIRICRDKFPQLEFQVADAADLSSLRDGSFGAIVIAFNGLDYVIPEERRAQCLRECFRVLRPGGVLIFSSHNPRAVLVCPAWSRERLRALAARVVGSESTWCEVLTTLLVPLKAVHSVVRASFGTVARLGRRVGKAYFWRGEGYALDAVHGGLMTHYWTPRHAIAAVSSFGFRLLTCEGDDYPRAGHALTTDWYYYVFARNDFSAGVQSCA